MFRELIVMLSAAILFCRSLISESFSVNVEVKFPISELFWFSAFEKLNVDAIRLIAKTAHMISEIVAAIRSLVISFAYRELSRRRS